MLIKTAEFVISSARADQCPSTEGRPEYAFIGRSNVGKSSLLTPQRIDLEFIQWLGEEGVPFSIIFTKADKNKTGELRKNVNQFLDELRKEWEELPPHFVTSSAQGRGRDEVLDYIDQINAQFHENA